MGHQQNMTSEDNQVWLLYSAFQPLHAVCSCVVKWAETASTQTGCYSTLWTTQQWLMGLKLNFSLPCRNLSSGLHPQLQTLRHCREYKSPIDIHILSTDQRGSGLSPHMTFSQQTEVCYQFEPSWQTFLQPTQVICLPKAKKSWLECQAGRPKGNLAYLNKTKRAHEKLGLNLVASFCHHCITLWICTSNASWF